jgi:hypothetical protein
MDSKTFIENALRTEAPIERLNFNLGALNQLLGVAVATANLVDLSKKTIAYGKPLDTEKMSNQILVLQGAINMLASSVHRAGIPEDTPIPLHQPNLRLLHASIGMFGEAGEFIEAIKKSIMTGELDGVNVSEELADSDWYKSVAHDEIGIPEEVCRQRVIEKLRIRFPDKFSLENAENRDLAAERVALEGSA